MPAFTFISKKLGSLLVVLFLAMPFSAMAQGSTPYGGSNQVSDDENSTGHALSGPFSDFGEFSASEDEESDEKFFQSGRFFGVGLGIGITTATGNAGRLYKPGFPAIDFRLNYWFDFFVALQLNVKNSVHIYDAQPDGKTNTNLFRLLGQIKVFLDTKDLSAPLSFIGPNLIVGCGMYRRTDNFQSIDNGTQTASAFGLNFGGGLELTIKPKKFYLNLESIVNVVTFRDAFDDRFSKAPGGGVADRRGYWIDTVAAFTWTW